MQRFLSSARRELRAWQKGLETALPPAHHGPGRPAQAGRAHQRGDPRPRVRPRRRELGQGDHPDAEALEFAFKKGLDLVEVAANADPPVARVMTTRSTATSRASAKQARKHQPQIQVKEIVEAQDREYMTRRPRRHVERFLGQRAKVKVTIMFRGADGCTWSGRDLLMRLAEDVKELARSSSSPFSTVAHGHGSRAEQER